MASSCRITSDYSRMNTHIARSAVQAADDTLRDVQTRQARVTGRLIASEHIVGEGVEVFGKVRLKLVSSAPYADAREYGANARQKASVKSGTKRRKGTSGPVLNRATRRGPHMVGNHVVRGNGPRFIGHMTSRLRSTW
jgi:hypothetical protein